MTGIQLLDLISNPEQYDSTMDAGDIPTECIIQLQLTAIVATKQKREREKERKRKERKREREK
jgi:hypothetical protein